MLFNMHSVQDGLPPSPSPKGNLAMSTMPRIRNPFLERTRIGQLSLGPSQQIPPGSQLWTQTETK